MKRAQQKKNDETGKATTEDSLQQNDEWNWKGRPQIVPLPIERVKEREREGEKEQRDEIESCTSYKLPIVYVQMNTTRCG